MKKLCTVLLLLFSAVLTEAQVAIIQDTDGYTNVRKGPDAQSEIIHRINTNEVFWYEVEKEDQWVTVYIPKNDFSFSATHPDYVRGFIHKSRLRPLENIPPYRGVDFAFQYIIESFSPANKIIDKRENRWVVAIDGRPVWGTDGNLPRTQIKEINVKVHGQHLPISRAFYEDIYECTNSFKIYKNGDTYFVHQWNSDGAGAYQIVWVFTKEGLKQRLVGSNI